MAGWPQLSGEALAAWRSSKTSLQKQLSELDTQPGPHYFPSWEMSRNARFPRAGSGKLPQKLAKGQPAWSWDLSKPQRQSWVRLGQACSSLVHVDLTLLPDVPVVIPRANGPRLWSAAGAQAERRQYHSLEFLTGYSISLFEWHRYHKPNMSKISLQIFASQICSFHVSSTHVVVSSSFQLLRP